MKIPKKYSEHALTPQDLGVMLFSARQVVEAITNHRCYRDSISKIPKSRTVTTTNRALGNNMNFRDVN
jgi:hypothetical protein